MSTISILKIESKESKLLFSRNATQELSLISKKEVLRDLNGNPFFVSDKCDNSDTKLKCVIECKEPIDISILKKNEPFKIYSIIKFRKNNSNSPPEDCPYVDGSFEKIDDYITFNPILEMYLVNFKCKSDNDNNLTWKLEFEEK